MKRERVLEIAYIVAKRKILDTKIPPISTPAFGKWVDELARDLGLTQSEFAEFAQIAFKEAFGEVVEALEEFKEKRRRVGFIS